MNPTEIIDLFAQQGCKSYQSEFVWAKKIGMIKAFLFDWDGVFHSGSKGPSYPGTFSEEDSMGLNMLRFAHYLKKGNLPNGALGKNKLEQIDYQSVEPYLPIFMGVAYFINL